MKTCSKCGEEKPLSSFTQREPGKYRADCKVCHGKVISTWGKNNRDRIYAAYRKDYEANPSKYREYGKQWRKDNPEKARAIGRKNWHKNPEKHILGGARARAAKLGIPFDLTVEDITPPEYCPVLGIKLERGRENRLNSPSVDRIIPELGYVRGNVIVVSMLANMIKTCATVDQLKAVASFYEQLIQ